MKRESLIYDVGLHLGEDTDFYLRKGFCVVAFEADPDHAEHCKRRFTNEIADDRLVIVEGAIVDPADLAPGQREVGFYRNEKNTAFGTVQTAWAERNERANAPSQETRVAVINFSAVLREHGVPRYMKIDIEGSDEVCLRALEAFDERPDYVSIESNKTSLAAIRGEIDLLRSLGYDRFQAVEQSHIPQNQRPPAPPREGQYVDQTFEVGCSGLFGRELDEDGWMTRRQVLGRYRWIRAGYWLLGDGGLLYRLNGLPWAGKVQTAVRRTLRRRTRGAVPGWYDTHARLANSKQ